MLLILLSFFYISTAFDPIHFRANAWLAIGARSASVAFFFAHMGSYRLIGLFDAAFAIPQVVLLSLIPAGSRLTSEVDCSGGLNKSRMRLCR